MIIQHLINTAEDNRHKPNAIVGLPLIPVSTLKQINVNEEKDKSANKW
jgi:hypothetical protein